MRSVVITGVSTGIGWATAKLLLDRGFRVFGSVRKQADADRLKTGRRITGFRMGSGPDGRVSRAGLPLARVRRY